MSTPKLGVSKKLTVKKVLAFRTQPRPIYNETTHIPYTVVHASGSSRSLPKTVSSERETCTISDACSLLRIINLLAEMCHTLLSPSTSSMHYRTAQFDALRPPFPPKEKSRWLPSTCKLTHPLDGLIQRDAILKVKKEAWRQRISPPPKKEAGLHTFSSPPQRPGAKAQG